MANNIFKKIFLGLAFFSLVFYSFPTNTFAEDNVEELQEQINEKREKLEELDAEIRRQKALLDNTSGRADTLENTVNQLEASRRKITTDISQTETSIEKAELTINKLTIEISQKEIDINRNSDALAESVRRMNNLEQVSLVEKFLGYESISDFWNDFEQTEKIQKQLHTEVEMLLDLHEDLTESEEQKRAEAASLSLYKVELSSEQEAVEYTKKEKEVILTQTKNEEARYQILLNQKLAEKDAFEDELLEIESKLQFLIDPESYPVARKGILEWPLDQIRITQNFGGSSFAKTNPHVYGRAFHPGTDFGVPIGTKVYSVSDGVIMGRDNTDLYPGCRAWGGWIMVKHDNGLSSLYAHLSSFTATVGQRVTAGQQIALSGNSGISTGPHLHLSLYASQGVKVGPYGSYKAGTGCAATNATGPFADLDAYLDPLEYLPSL